MANSIEYRGFKVIAKPRQVSLTGEWIIQTDIARGAAVKRFYADRTFKSREEAAKECLEFGKRLIDGEVPQFSASDLP